MIFINRALEERGIAAEYLITSGNEAGLGIADYIAFFADQPELKVILVYIEAIADLEKFKAACRWRARRRQGDCRGQARPVGKRPQRGDGAYRVARRHHRGVRRGRRRARRHPRRHARRCRRDHRAAGPYRRARAAAASAPSLCRARFAGVLYDAAERNGLQFPQLAAETIAKLESHSRRRLAGRQSDRRRLRRADQRRQISKPAIEALQADPNVDMMLFQEEAAALKPAVGPCREFTSP